MLVRVLALLSLALLPALQAHAEPTNLTDAKAQKAAVKCQKAIDQSGAKLFAAKLKSLDACSTAVLACIQTKPADAACLQKATGKCTKALLDAIPQAEVNASAKIVKGCGAPLRPADLLASDGLGIGAQAAQCNADFGVNICANLPALAQCLVTTGSRGAERVFASQQPRARELIEQVLAAAPLAYLPPFPGCQDCAQTPSSTLGKAVAACGATVTKAGRTFAATVGKGLGGCIDKVFACLQTKPGDAKCLAKAAAACDATAGKLGAARAKLRAAIDKRCTDAAGLPFATLADAAALNLDALADDCATLGVGALGTLGDYVECVQRQHECTVVDVLRQTLPRTATLVDDDLLGTAGALLDAAACPTSLPSYTRTARARPRAGGTFPTALFFTMTKKSGTGTGTKASAIPAPQPPSSPTAVRRVAFPLGTPGRFLPGFSQLLKIGYSGKKSRARTTVEAEPPTLIVAVTRSDLAIEDHLEIPLDAVTEGSDGEVDIEIAYDAAPPSCVFGIAFAVEEDGEVSDYTTVEQVADTVLPPTATPEPVPTSTPGATVVPTTTATPLVTATATDGVTPSASPLGGATPTTTATPSAVFAYALTTTDDPAAPGNTTALLLTVSNLTNAPQNATLSFTVPAFTTYGVYGAGSVRSVVFSGVAAGTARTAIVPLTVTSGANAPPDGTVVSVTFNDTARNASVSRSFVTDASPPADVTLATAQGSVAPGATFTYTVGFHNADLGPIADVELSIAVPPGASFVAAENGVTPDGDGVVRWPLGTVAGSASGQRSVTFGAPDDAQGAFVVAATLAAGGTAIAHASAATIVYAAPTFAYTLTTIDDLVAPAGTALFRLTVTNLTNAGQDATLSFRVPDFTSYGVYGSGSVRSVAFGVVAAGASESALVPLSVHSGAAAPPDGTLITLAFEDGARSTAISRTIVSDSAQAADLKLATAAATVAPSGSFTYELAFHNAQIGPLAGAELSVAVPGGASFVAAEDGVTPDADGVVRWPLGTLAGSVSGRRTVTLQAAAGAHADLVVDATLRGADGEVVTTASAATAVAANPTFAYTLTTTDDLVAPGGTAAFLVTTTNRTNATQSTTLSFRVPDYTAYGVYGPGSVRSVAFGSVAAGASASALLPLTVQSGAAAPPDGTLITFALDDGARGAAVSRTIVSDATAAAELTLATPESSVAPGGTFTYTLAYHNAAIAPLDDAELSVAVPVGAGFVGAETGVVPDAAGVVRWPLGTLAGNASGQRTVTFQAEATAATSLLVEATLRDAASEVVTRASAATPVYASPAFAYTVTSTDDDPIAPGRYATFLVTATNLTNAVQSATLGFRVPDFTSYGVYGAGSVRSLAFGDVAAGGSQTALVPLLVSSGAAAPANGTLIALALHDGARGAAASRAVVVQSTVGAELKVTAAQGTVAPSGAVTYALAFHNTAAGSRAGVELALPVPSGSSFVSADGGGTLDADGVVRWSIGTLASGAGGTRTVSVSADPGRQAPLLADATLRNGAAEILARASTATAIYATPAFSYVLSAANDTAAPGQVASFTIALTNLTNTVQSATMSFRVPDFSAYGVYGPGTVRSVAFSNVAAGGTVQSFINLTIASGAQSPPSGTPIDLTTTDGARGASVGRTITVN